MEAGWRFDDIDRIASLDAEYDSRRSNLLLIEDEAKRMQALAALDAWYLQEEGDAFQGKSFLHPKDFLLRKFEIGGTLVMPSSLLYCLCRNYIIW